MARPSLDLVLEVSNLDGSNAETFPASRERTDGAARLGNFTTKLQTGHEHLSADLYRDPRKTFNSPRRFQTAKVIGLGEEAWHGEITSVPQSRADSLEADGYYGALKDAGNVSEIYIDQETSRWRASPNQRKAVDTGTRDVGQDGQVLGDALQTRLPSKPWTLPPQVELWYAAPAGAAIGKVTANWARSAWVWPLPENFFWAIFTSTDPTFATGNTSSGNLVAAGPNTGTVEPTNSPRYALLQFVNTTTATTLYLDDDDRHIDWTAVKVFGDHGLANIYASEVIKNAVGKYCPILTATDKTIDATTYAIGQLVFDKGTVADIIERCNAFHVWEIAVWGRTLYFRPSRDRTDYDFLLSTYRGDSLDRAPMAVDDDEPSNGIWVNYTDVLTGRAERVGPLGTSGLHDAAGDASLLTTNANNPCVREGRDRFPPIDIGFNCTRADAILMGSLRLAERQIRTYAGTGVAGPYVRNRAGQWVPSWKIKAGDRVKYAGENIIRRVYSTSYNHRDCKNALTFEKPPSTVAGIQERIQMSLQAANL